MGFNNFSSCSNLRRTYKLCYSVIQLKDGRLASASGDKTIKIWDLTTSQAVQTLKGHTDYVYSVIQLKDGRLASASGDNTIKIWD